MDGRHWKFLSCKDVVRIGYPGRVVRQPGRNAQVGIGPGQHELLGCKDVVWTL